MLTAVVSSQGDGRESHERELGIHHGKYAKLVAALEFLPFGVVLILVRRLGCLRQSWFCGERVSWPRFGAAVELSCKLTVIAL
jgi:hypothetical protein